MRRLRSWALWAVLACALPGWATAQQPVPDFDPETERVTLDFQDTELSDVINMISRLTKKNFLFDDRVRGRVTVISPSPVTAAEAYRVFEAILQVKGFTTTGGMSLACSPPCTRRATWTGRSWASCWSPSRSSLTPATPRWVF